ncbi:MAG TPA: ATP synthase F0 subunit B, partial [Blastocatellia bacterium]|nr:ATP synthase F0 subunit B [Blastocatellia bacterium]
MITTNLLMTLFVSDLSAFSLQHFVPGTIVLINPAIPKAVNLVIFFTILYFLLRKPTREFFTNRYNEIRVAIDQAAKEKSEAEAKMKELDARMSRLDADIADIKTQAQREAEAERERITAAAQAETEKFRVMAK